MGKRKKSSKGKPRFKIIGDIFRTKKGRLRLNPKKKPPKKSK